MAHRSPNPTGSADPAAPKSRPLGAPLRTFFRGLAAILPLALTGSLITWAVVSGETLLRNVILLWLPEEQYWPGMGFVLSIALVFVTGLLQLSLVTTAFIVHHSLMLPIPIHRNALDG